MSQTQSKIIGINNTYRILRAINIIGYIGGRVFANLGQIVAPKDSWAINMGHPQLGLLCFLISFG